MDYNIRRVLKLLNPDAEFFTGFDDCLVGYTQQTSSRKPVAIYDASKMHTKMARAGLGKTLIDAVIQGQLKDMECPENMPVMAFLLRPSIDYDFGDSDIGPTPAAGTPPLRGS